MQEVRGDNYLSQHMGDVEINAYPRIRDSTGGGVDGRAEALRSARLGHLLVAGDGAGEGERALVQGIRPRAGAGAGEPGAGVVVAGDRDSDIYERLKWQSKDREEAGLAARANAAGVL